MPDKPKQPKKEEKEKEVIFVKPHREVYGYDDER